VNRPIEVFPKPPIIQPTPINIVPQPQPYINVNTQPVNRPIEVFPKPPIIQPTPINIVPQPQPYINVNTQPVNRPIEVNPKPPILQPPVPLPQANQNPVITSQPHPHVIPLSQITHKSSNLRIYLEYN
jgi:hypothetical protein